MNYHREVGLTTMKLTRKRPNTNLPIELRTTDSPIRECYLLGRVYTEKCEFARAKKELENGLALAKKEKDFVAVADFTSALLRLAVEDLDLEEISKLEPILSQMVHSNATEISSNVWYAYACHIDAQGDAKRSRRIFIKALKALKRSTTPDHKTDPEYILMEARIWTMLARGLVNQRHLRRAEYLFATCLRHYEALKLRTINGLLYLGIGVTMEKQGRLEEALEYYKKSHISFLAEHNWYYHLYVLYGYARICRLQQNYAQAYWYLDLLDRATANPGFGMLRSELALERSRLENDAIDLMVDSTKGVIRTREGGMIQVGKQYILLDILKALSRAHEGTRTAGTESGLSKAEIIEQVWKERYRPEAHDNKLYYNINRLRKLIEPDCRRPRYLLSWKEGYRLAPSLRIHFTQQREDR